jgi:arsenite methyltransferase
MAKPNYGIDAPEVVRRFFFFGVVGIALGFVLIAWPQLRTPLTVRIAPSFITTGLSCVACGIVMIWGSKVGKIRWRERIVDGLALRGDERVLDVGCGSGLMLTATARRLPRGQATGIDLWQAEDQSGNAASRTLANATAEGVADRVEIKTGDARKLPFPAEYFDAIVSSWAIHNIYDASGRAEALDEMVRVLKPGGRIALVDIRHTGEYAAALQSRGLVVERSAPNFLFVIPSYLGTATKS